MGVIWVTDHLRVIMKVGMIVLGLTQTVKVTLLGLNKD
jgi:ribosomal protein L30E